MNVPDIYRSDLAYIHDVGYSQLSESWAAGLLGILRDAEIVEGAIVDVGCGGGGWLAQLVTSGYTAIGFDVSAPMIELARQRVPQAETHVASVWDCSIPRCRAVTALSEVLCYRAGPADRPMLQPLFARIFAALEPGGVFVFDVTEVGLEQHGERTFAEGDGWACLVRFEHEAASQRLHRHITSFRRVDDLYRRSEEQHTVQLFEAASVMDDLRYVGFEVERVDHFGAAPLLPHRAGFIAKRPRA